MRSSLSPPNHVALVFFRDCGQAAWMLLPLLNENCFFLIAATSLRMSPRRTANPGAAKNPSTHTNPTTIFGVYVSDDGFADMEMPKKRRRCWQRHTSDDHALSRCQNHAFFEPKSGL
jgi:hypothetical protein